MQTGSGKIFASIRHFYPSTLLNELSFSYPNEYNGYFSVTRGCYLKRLPCRAVNFKTASAPVGKTVNVSRLLPNFKKNGTKIFASICHFYPSILINELSFSHPKEFNCYFSMTRGYSLKRLPCIAVNFKTASVPVGRQIMWTGGRSW